MSSIHMCSSLLPKTANYVNVQKHGEGNMKPKIKGRFFHWIVVCVDHKLVNDLHRLYLK